MTASSGDSKEAKDIVSSYTTEEKIISFRTEVDFSYSPSKRVTMVVPYESISPYL